MLKEKDKTKYIKQRALPLIKQALSAWSAFEHWFHPEALPCPTPPRLCSSSCPPLWSRSLPNSGDALSELSHPGRPRHCGITLSGQAPCHLHVLRARERLKQIEREGDAEKLKRRERRERSHRRREHGGGGGGDAPSRLFMSGLRSQLSGENELLNHCSQTFCLLDLQLVCIIDGLFVIDPSAYCDM